MDTYQIHIQCTNCGYKSTTPPEMYEIPKGTLTFDFLSPKPCPVCGCKTLTENR